MPGLGIQGLVSHYCICSIAFLVLELTQNLDDLKKRIRLLEHESEKLRRKLWKYERRPSMLTAYMILTLGSIALISAIIFSSSILAFIGLGLVFWGVLLLYLRPTKYVKASILTAVTSSSLAMISEEVKKLGMGGRAVYLPPDLGEVKDRKVNAAKKEGRFTDFGKICLGAEHSLIPPGAGLASLYEKELGVDLAKADLNYLQTRLPKLFLEGLEVAEALEMKVKGNQIKVGIVGSYWRDLCKEMKKLYPNICESIGCPLISSIALTITRTAGRPVIIEEEKSEDNGKIQVIYKLLETESGPLKSSARKRVP